jgi:riboflavin kinase/FMN adenylyltransferase
MQVITFEPYPAQVLRPASISGRLTTAAEKLELIRATGADEILVLPFTLEFSRTTAEAFLHKLAGSIRPREVWVGEEFAFGKDREGTLGRMSILAETLGFAFVALPRVELAGQVVSSSRIRGLIGDGDVAAANEMLGRWFAIGGVVQEGAKVGRTIGFPTANVQPPDDLVQAADGIYASVAQLDGSDTRLPAMTYIGTRPALNTGARMIETHLLDFDAEIYGQQLVTAFVQRIRPDSDFASVDALVAQMKQDELEARAILRSQTGNLAQTGYNQVWKII